jgi:MSHA biogenesis protein MshO
MTKIVMSRQSAFTLVELVIVIVILSALGIMTSSYIGKGIDIYTGVADRDKSLNSVRFVMERLRREVSNALPNSLELSDQCLTFTPIIASSVYSDFPISPSYGNTGTISPISDYNYTSGDKAVVYLLFADQLNSTDKVNTIASINTDKDTLTFDPAVSFSLNSPAKRIYIIQDTVSYCFIGDDLKRQVNDGEYVLMAENIKGNFKVSNATLQRNALVKVYFELDFDGQEVPIEQTLHVNNTP